MPLKRRLIYEFPRKFFDENEKLTLSTSKHYVEGTGPKIRHVVCSCRETGRGERSGERQRREMRGKSVNRL